jgi:hypothetical protein
MWCRIAVEGGCIGYVVVMVVGDGGYNDLVEVVEGYDSLAEVGWHWVFGAALDGEGYRRCIVALWALRLVDVLPPRFGVLSDCLTSHDGFLFLPEPLYFLLDPD